MTRGQEYQLQSHEERISVLEESAGVKRFHNPEYTAAENGRINRHLNSKSTEPYGNPAYTQEENDKINSAINDWQRKQDPNYIAPVSSTSVSTEQDTKIAVLSESVSSLSMAVRSIMDKLDTVLNPKPAEHVFVPGEPLQPNQ